MSRKYDTISRAAETPGSNFTAPEISNSPTPALEYDRSGPATADDFASVSAKLLTIHAQYAPDGSGVVGDGDLFARVGLKARGLWS